MEDLHYDLKSTSNLNTVDEYGLVIELITCELHRVVSCRDVMCRDVMCRDVV